MSETLHVAAPEFVETGVRIQVAIAIAKAGVNADKRTVRGFISTEAVDLHGEEVDFDCLKAALTFWRGNVREMHQPVAVGRAVDIEIDDAARTIAVESFVSKGAEATWLKCLDGTLGYYSLGGTGDRVTGLRRDGSRGPRLLMRKMTELSLVDSGACDGTEIAVVKVNDAGDPVAVLGERDERADAAQGADSGSTSTPLDVDTTLALTVKATEALAAPASPAETVVEKATAFRSEQYDIEAALAIIAYLNRLMTSESYESLYGGEAAPDNGVQLQQLRIAASFVLDFLLTEFDQQFTDMTDVQRSAVDAARTAVEKAGARHSKRDLAVLQSAHDNVVALGAACGAPMKTADTQTEPVIEKAADAQATPAVTEPAAVVETPAVEAPVVEKAAVAAPAVDAPVTAAAIADIVKAAVAEVSTSFAAQLEEQRVSSTATITELQGQIAKLNDQPTTGGPVASAHASVIEKTLAGAPVAAADALSAGGTAQLIGALTQVGLESNDPAVRAQLAQKCIELQLKSGVGSTALVRPSVS